LIWIQGPPLMLRCSGKHRQIRCRTSESYHAKFLRFSFMHCNIYIRKYARTVVLGVSLGELGTVLIDVGSLLRGRRKKHYEIASFALAK
jgi:hypothetical protein